MVLEELARAAGKGVGEGGAALAWGRSACGTGLAHPLGGSCRTVPHTQDAWHLVVGPGCAGSRSPAVTADLQPTFGNAVSDAPASARCAPW